MKGAKMAVSALIAAAFALAAAQGPPADALWLKAVDVARQAEKSGIKARSVTIETVVKKGSGAIEHTSKVVMRLPEDGDDDSPAEVVSAVEDGKDMTQEAKKAEEEGRRRKKANGGKDPDDTITINLGYHPFSPKSQDQVTARRDGSVMLEGRPAVLYSFSQAAPSGKSAVKGKAWLDPESGAPLQVEASPDPLPRFVSKMTTTVMFEVAPGGQWRPKSSTIRGEGGFLFYHRLVESDVVFSDFGFKPVTEKQLVH